MNMLIFLVNYKFFSLFLLPLLILFFFPLCLALGYQVFLGNLPFTMDEIQLKDLIAGKAERYQYIHICICLQIHVWMNILCIYIYLFITAYHVKRSSKKNHNTRVDCNNIQQIFKNVKKQFFLHCCDYDKFILYR